VNNNGSEGLIHKNRDQTGNRKLDVKIVKKAEKYLKKLPYIFSIQD